MRKQLTVTITGEQGSGKTLLARALARLLENRGLFVVEETGGQDRDGHFDVVTFETDDDARETLAGLGSEIDKAPTLDYTVPDVHGNTPPRTNAFLREFRHTGNGKIYVVTGFAWMGEDDVWGFIHREAGKPFAVPIVRPLSHLTGRRTTGELRYEAVVRDPAPVETERSLDAALGDHPFGLNGVQKAGEGWMVVGTDNYNRESVADFIAARDVRSEEMAVRMANSLNQERDPTTYYRAVSHDYRLSRGLEDLV